MSKSVQYCIIHLQENNERVLSNEQLALFAYNRILQQRKLPIKEELVSIKESMKYVFRYVILIERYT